MKFEGLEAQRVWEEDGTALPTPVLQVPPRKWKGTLRFPRLYMEEHRKFWWEGQSEKVRG